MKSRIVIVAYKPKPGKEEALKSLLLEHHFTLKKLDLVTDREAIIMQASDKTFLEVLEWKSEGAIQQAHLNRTVQKMWLKYDDVCDYLPVANIVESTRLFSSYSPVL